MSPLRVQLYRGVASYNQIESRSLTCQANECIATGQSGVCPECIAGALASRLTQARHSFTRLEINFTTPCAAPLTTQFPSSTLERTMSDGSRETISPLKSKYQADFGAPKTVPRCGSTTLACTHSATAINRLSMNPQLPARRYTC